MRRVGSAVAMGLLVSVLAWAQAPAQDARTVLDAASTAMGAANLRTIEFTGSGVTFRHGQALVPFGPLPRFDVKSLGRGRTRLAR